MNDYSPQDVKRLAQERQLGTFFAFSISAICNTRSLRCFILENVENFVENMQRYSTVGEIKRIFATRW
jgi:hypothetical protein